MNRCKNFTEAEKKLLITLVEKYKSTIECKKTDAKSAKEKLQAWTELCKEFNSSSMYAKREVKQLQSSWKNKNKGKSRCCFCTARNPSNWRRTTCKGERRHRACSK